VKLIVCALDDVASQIGLHAPAGVISLLGPSQAAPELPPRLARLALHFHDIAQPQAGLQAPDAETVERLLSFATGFAPEDSLLCHCWMGISRSPAAAFIVACAMSPSRPEAEIAASLRALAPSATPNPLLVALADTRLGRCGRMTAAIQSIRRGEDAATGRPFILDIGNGIE
jgi:predicted protein tyrosine phosphatase